MRRPVRLSVTCLEDRSNPAAIGALNPAFGTAGVFSSNFLAGENSAFRAVVSVGNGLVVSAGTDGNDFVVARFLPNGTLDPKFGNAGISVIDFGGTDDAAFAIAQDSDGSLVVAGTTNLGNGQFAIAKLDSNGALVSSFGTAGKATLDVSTGSDIAYAVAVNNGVVTLAGTANATGTSTAAIARLTSAGVADSSFGTAGSGKNIFSTGGGDEARALFIQDDGNIVLGGYTGLSTGGVLDDAILFRVLANGSAIDNSFGNKTIFTGGGTARVYDFGGVDKFLAGTTDSAGRYVMVGSSSNANDGIVARINTDGSLDTSFNSTGSVSVSFGGTETENGVIVDSATGKIVVVGSTGTGSAASMTMVRLTSTGAFDTSFDADGKASYPISGGVSGFGVVRLPGGDYVAVGSASANAVALRVVGSVGLPSGLLATGQSDGGGLSYTLDPARVGYKVPGTAVDLVPDAGIVHGALADVTGDGVPDRIAGVGPGGSRVVVRDGVTGDIVFDTNAFESGFTGGVFVAGGDFNNDGYAEIVVTADQGGGTRVLVYDGQAAATGATVILADFLGLADTAGVPDTTFRGGLHPAVADVNGDGIPDLVVAAGDTGGPRITVWDGVGIAAAGGGQPTINPLANFFAFESDLRDGAFVTVGDVNGDGKADLIFGHGPSAAPRVRIADAVGVLAIGDSSLDSEPGIDIADFIAGSTTGGGIRVVARDIDGDQLADLVTGSGEGQLTSMQVYLGTALLSSSSNPATAQDPIDPFGTILPAGVFVG